jgi:hypothetical protein
MFRRLVMEIGRLVRPLTHAAFAMLILSNSAWTANAQSHDDHMVASASQQAHKPTPQENELVQAVREATERFRDVSRATAEGYALQFGCVSGGDFGAMGLHFVRGDILHDGDVNANEPEILLFEPTRNGGISLTGADFIVFKDEWEAKHAGEGPPSLNGQLFHLFDSPNRFGLDPFYTLHVWAWKENPNGTFTNWNPNVSCDAFNPKTEPAADR